jgi:hypothetical protein
LKKYNPYELSSQAAASLASAKNQQISNGDVLDRTLRSYHFEVVIERDDEGGEKRRFIDLHPLGRNELNRIARRHAKAPHLEVFVETAFDPNFRGTAEETIAARDKADSQRVKIVTEYLQLALRRESVTVLVINPPPVGLDSDEARTAFRNGVRGFDARTPSGLLRRFEGGTGGDMSGFGGGSDFGGGGGDPFGGGGAPYGGVDPLGGNPNYNASPSQPAGEQPAADIGTTPSFGP